ncbi:MAG: NYN domain-containing protein [Flavobacteriales bacterium]|nr:NYN domain-containing protein [Flavobacteriales bacterium]MBK6944184.1 NYN domain-containing protein [Flavobacteriales bacterium]MBK7240386.1 NYN domain-containing protein [Flavobacteriales bacterium]MBK7295318.1 NYN domain-containing protein [Flavobacteriales bacterium]MBK9533851.1 NYN domain-containing protein [Flavobacteriales bacterium]
MKKINDTTIALLIDGDNAAPKRLAAILEEVSKQGTITIRRIYGDWTTTGMTGWKDLLNSNAIQPVQQFAYTKGKNSTDSALIIDAMDILHGELVDAFCIVSSDSDYTRLATRIRESGLFVMGVGEKKTPDAFVKACERFIYVENLDIQEGPKQEATRAGRGKTSSVKQALSANAGLMRKMRTAFNIAKGEEEEVSLSLIGQALRRLDPGFDPRSYGHASLSSLVSALKDQLETRREEKGNMVMVRFKN